MSKFELGRLMMTHSINVKIAESKDFAKDIAVALEKYQSRNWGVVDEEDWIQNNLAIENNDGRVLAAYKTCEGKVWIITEADRSVTTILFPDEY